MIKKRFPAVTVRLEPNRDGTKVLWHVRCDDGTEARGFAKSRLDGLQKAYAVLDAVPNAACAVAGPRLVIQ